MKPEVRNKVNRIIYEIDALSRELEAISHGIQSEFKGIGAVKCASSLQATADKYRRVGNELRRI